MKQKLDFVTNSSSCSFVAYGINIDIDELKKHAETIYNSSSDTFKKYTKTLEEFKDSEDLDYLITDAIDGIGNLSCSRMPYEERLMIGTCPSNMKLDQTKKEFLESIVNDFHKIGIVDLKIEQLDWIEEAWMDN